MAVRGYLAAFELSFSKSVVGFSIFFSLSGCVVLFLFFLPPSSFLSSSLSCPFARPSLSLSLSFFLSKSQVNLYVFIYVNNMYKYCLFSLSDSPSITPASGSVYVSPFLCVVTLAWNDGHCRWPGRGVPARGTSTVDS